MYIYTHAHMKKQRHLQAYADVHTPWHIYTPSTIPILTLTGSILRLFGWGRGGDMGFAEMEEANTRISRLTHSTTGESRTAAWGEDGRKQRRKEAKWEWVAGCHGKVKVESTRRANDDRVEGREREERKKRGKKEAVERTVVSLVRLIRWMVKLTAFLLFS